MEFKGTIEAPNAISPTVLIESDWNLKKRELSPVSVYPCRINRIRLEFKGNGGTGDTQKTITVLIESDWNLKWEETHTVNAESLVLIEPKMKN